MFCRNAEGEILDQYHGILVQGLQGLQIKSSIFVCQLVYYTVLLPSGKDLLYLAFLNL